MLFFLMAAFLALVAPAVAHGVTVAISPTAAAPATCTGTYSGAFEITVVNVVSKRDHIAPRDCSTDGDLVVTLSGGVLTDSKGRTGYIASNYQFQFDNPPQAGAIYTAGFSVCGNGSLALGGSAVFFQCQSGSFYNLYDRSWAAQCTPVELVQIQCGSSSSGQAGQNGDGQVVGTSIVETTIVSAISDGQPQVITTVIPVPLCQISDGQAQVHTTPCASISAIPTTSVAPVSQFSDGQIQVTPATPAPTKSGSAPATTTSPASGGSGGSGSAITSASVSSSKSSSFANTTLSTSSSSGTSSSSSSTTSKAVSSSGAGPGIELGSLSALAVGIMGAILVL